MHILVAVMMLLMTSTAIAQEGTWQKPFSSTSPWNTKVSPRAQFVPANLRPASWMTVDEEYFFVTTTSDPTHRVYAPIDWSHRCGGTRVELESIPFPDDVVIPDADAQHTPNNCAAILLPDGRTVRQINPLTRCTPGGPLAGWLAATVDLHGDGIPGGHGGSGLSSLGGSIRRGEFSSSKPISHALKVNIWGQKYLWKFAAGDSGFRWPANRHDGCAPDCYGGTNPALRLGSLLAIPASIADTLLMETIPGRKIRDALRAYGAYVVDDTAWDAYALCVESGVRDEFRSSFQMSIESQSTPWYRDCMKLFGALHVVDNNSSSSIGGHTSVRLSSLEATPSTR